AHTDPPPFPTRRSSDLHANDVFLEVIATQPTAGDKQRGRALRSRGSRKRGKVQSYHDPSRGIEQHESGLERVRIRPRPNSHSPRSEEHTSELQSPYDLV